MGSLPSDPEKAVLIGIIYGFLVKGEPGLSCTESDGSQTVMSQFNNITYNFIKEVVVSIPSC